jgi:hypothetical protein
MQSAGMRALLPLLLFLGAEPAITQPPTRPEQLGVYLDTNYAEVRRLYGNWRYQARFRRDLDSAHRAIIAALRRHDDAAFGAGMARFIDLSKGEILRRANIMDATTHGSGRGSSETFSRGYNTGVAWGSALVRRFADRNEITCMYLFAESPMSAGESFRRLFSGEHSLLDNETFRTCSLPRLQRLRGEIDRGRLTIAGLRRAIGL